MLIYRASCEFLHAMPAEMCPTLARHMVAPIIFLNIRFALGAGFHTGTAFPLLKLTLASGRIFDGAFVLGTGLTVMSGRFTRGAYAEQTLVTSENGFGARNNVHSGTVWGGAICIFIWASLNVCCK